MSFLPSMTTAESKEASETSATANAYRVDLACNHRTGGV